MKKLYTLLVIAFIGFVGNAQIVNIPDANFKAKLLAASSNNNTASTQPVIYNSSTGSYTVASYNKIDTNNDGEIQLSEAQLITYLRIPNSGISYLTGLENFVNLQYLKCDNNALIGSLNLYQLTALKYLDCSDGHLTALNVSQNAVLQFLDCSWNDLTTLNVTLNSALNYLNSYHNQLTAFDVSQNIALKFLYCGGTNQLTTLDLSQNTLLEDLACTNYLLTSLDVTNNPALKILNCNYNQITSLDLSQNLSLKKLYCDYNQIASLNLSQNTALEYLTCTDNNMSILSLLNNPVLVELNCNFNNFTTLNFENTALRNLNCSYNDLVNLFLKNGAAPWTILNFGGNPTLNYICTDEDDVVNVNSRCNSLGYSNCNVNSYCSFIPGGTYYAIDGNIRLDLDNNGCNVIDINVPNQKLTISNGNSNSILIANQTGSFFIPVQSGTFNVTPNFENPSYFMVSPPTTSVTFPTSTSPFTQNFCVTANGVRNDVEVSILPIVPARPGFDARYKIVYKNKGNQVSNGTLSLSFDDVKMDLVTASSIVNSTGTNSLSWNYANLNPFETREINLTFNVNSPMETPAVNNGDLLDFTAIVNPLTNDEILADNTSSLKQIVVGSYDPNDKTCIEGTTITPSMVGQYVHYVIRFENTGTFAAQNVVITDMIDTTKFDIATLVPQRSSHNFITRITNTNKVEFIFENINLPFDDANNDGFVAFKIKTKPTLVVGNTFSNSANIYFDYNFPIVTNTATTTVTALGTQDFDFGSVFTLSPVPAKDFLTITAQHDVLMSSSSIYNTLGQLVQVNTNTNETIDVSGLQSGSYFIKITSDKGSATGKFIKE